MEVGLLQPETVEWLNRITHWKKQHDQRKLPFDCFGDNFKDLTNFLQGLKLELQNCENVEESLQKCPQVGQLLAHICSVPVFLSDQALCEVLFECVFWFYVPNPVSALQRKSSSWALSQIRGLTSHRKDFFNQIPLSTTGLTQTDLYRLILEKIEVILEHAVESNCLAGKSKGFLEPATTNFMKISEWIVFCVKMQDNDWFRNSLPKLLHVLIKIAGPESKETENLLSQLTDTQADAYIGEVTVELPKDVLLILWNNYPLSLEQEVLSMLEYLCQQPNINDVDVTSLMELRGLKDACQTSPFIQGMVLAMVKQLQNEGADFALKNALQRMENQLSCESNVS